MINLQFYERHSIFSDPKEYLSLFDQLPDLIEQLCQIVHGLIIHRDETKKLYHFEIKERKLESETRYVYKILKIILERDKKSIIKQRSPKKRFFGSCRDFAILLCSMLRSKEIPARLRCGFASYFRKKEGKFSDHWICEYWDKTKNKWLMVDAEIGEEEKKYYHLDNFNNCDLTKSQFLVAGEVWQLCRQGKANPNLYGVHSIDVKGLWFIRSSVIRDFYALNKIELLPWDYTEFGDKPFDNISELKPSKIDIIDKISNLTINPDKNLSEIISLYKSDKRLKIEEIISYTIAGPKKIKI